MTKQARKALKTVGVPTIRWAEHYGAGQYFTRIGYSRSASGKRQQKSHYLGTDEKAAIAKAAALKHEWRIIRKRDGAGAVWPPSAKAAAKLVAASAPDPTLAKLSPQEMKAAIEKLHEDMADNAVELGQGEEGDGAVVRTPRQRIEQVREMYLQYRQGKLGIGNGQGVNQKTYINEVRNLKNALISLDQNILIDTFGYAELERLRDAIYRRVHEREGGISRRTANNYWNEVRRMFEWAHRQSYIGYRNPEDIDDLFKQKIKNANPINIVEYDAKLIKKIIKSATDRQRLYIYLALNLGAYQSDIGMIRRDEIVEFEGKTAIIRKRSKTKHQNEFEAMHTLWPETKSLLTKLMAGRNPNNLALLSDAGTPLYRSNCDSISDAYERLQKKTAALPFKQYRKIGATAIQRIGGDEARRLYKAGTIDSGDKVYVRESWKKLTPHLLTWGKELRRDGVLF